MGDMWHRIYTLIVKELIAVVRDPKLRISIFLPPLIQLLVFTFGATLDVKNISIGIWNRDMGEKAFELIERFYGAKVFSHIYFLNSEKEVASFLDEQKGIMVLSIDETFSRKLNSRESASLQLLLDGRKSNTAQIVTGYTSQVINQFNKDFCAKANIFQQNGVLVPRNWFNPNTLYYWYNIPCLVPLLAMLTCLVVTTQTVARERELGTFDQLLVSPLLPIEILIGKTVPGIIVGVIEGTLMLAIGALVLQVPFTGSLLLYLLSLIVFVSSISGVGLFISSLSATQQQAMLGTFIFMTPAVMLSGFATPIENMPTWLQPVSNFIPLTYMLIISKGIFLKAMPLKLVQSNVWPMLLIAAFTLTGAGLFFHRRLE
jgi:ABC-2 type transport system permease protein